MRPAQLIAEIKSRQLNNISRPIMVESSPGMGKTQIPQQVAAEMKIGCIVIHCPLSQPEDYGLPMPSADKKSVTFLIPSGKFPFVGSNFPERGILVMDEISQCNPDQQKIIANFIHERELHGQKLMPGWTIVCTGNRASDRAGATRLLSHLRDRVTSMGLEVSLDEWTQWALSNNVKTEVIAFLRYRPELLNSFDASREKNSTPRAWVNGVSTSLGLTAKESEFEVFSGDVGEGPASEFLGFLKIFRNLPSPDSVLLAPKTAPVPTDPATLYALCGALAHKADEKNFDRAMTYVGRIERKEFHVLFVKMSLAKNPEVANTKAYIAWSVSPENPLN